LTRGRGETDETVRPGPTGTYDHRQSHRAAHARPGGRRCADAPIAQLEEYFAGSRPRFARPIALTGGVFHFEVGNALVMPYPTRSTVGSIAAPIDRPPAVPAAGTKSSASTSRVAGSAGR
jgi:O6-methylguanine-DNA--protein-cysteine methyltransferase